MSKTPGQNQLKGVQLREGFECTIEQQIEWTDYHGAPEWFKELMWEGPVAVRITVLRDPKTRQVCRQTEAQKSAYHRGDRIVFPNGYSVQFKPVLSCSDRPWVDEHGRRIPTELALRLGGQVHYNGPKKSN